MIVCEFYCLFCCFGNDLHCGPPLSEFVLIVYFVAVPQSGSREIMNGYGGMERAKGTMESGSSTGKWADGSLGK